MGGRGSRSMSSGNIMMGGGSPVSSNVRIVSDTSTISDNGQVATMDVSTSNAVQSNPNVDYQNMSDDNFATYISDINNTDIPRHLSNDAFNKFTYKANINGKPQIVDSDAEVGRVANQNGHPIMYRTINAMYNSKQDVGMSAPDIANQTLNSRLQRSGDGIYGQGFYFATSKGGSAGYGHTRGNVDRTCQMTATLNSNAKIISYNSLMSMYQREVRSGSALGNQLRKIANSNTHRASDSALSIFALKRGYNVIDVGGGTGYYNILDRSALTVSKNFHSI